MRLYGIKTRKKVMFKILISTVVCSHRNVMIKDGSGKGQPDNCNCLGRGWVIKYKLFSET